MQLKPFLLDMWLATYEHDIEFNLAASEGPRWTLNEILSLASDEERQRFLNHELVYSRPAGADGLRAAIADMQDVNVDTVQVVTGASEALVVLMWLAAEAGANVVLPQPGYPPFSALPESLGIEIRYYALRKENDFRIDLEEIKQLADRNTKLILINGPHNPTGATISDAELDSLHEFTASREIQLVSDEVFHPIYHGQATRSASRLPHATVIHDFSKAFSLAGVRTGWIIEHDSQTPRALLECAHLFFHFQQHCRRNTGGDCHAPPENRPRENAANRNSESSAACHLHVRASRDPGLDSSSRRNDRFPMAGQWREQPRLLPSGRGTGHPARPRGLLGCALAFPSRLRGDDRQISRRPEPAGRIC